jgi:hypothetical protein
MSAPGCRYWSDCGVNGGGCCGLNRNGGRPSLGTCAGCIQRGENRLQGAGDAIAVALNATGIGPVVKRVIHSATGRDCNCDGRQRLGNKLLPCRKRANGQR